MDYNSVMEEIVSRADNATELLLEDCVEFSKKISPETREQ